jgi:5,6-dimethylbenzimidazole synthase
MDTPEAYSQPEIDALWRVMRERRDMRHFLPHAVPRETIEHLVEAAHLAPSVGLMQPWRFLHIRSAALRERIHELVRAEHLATAAAMPSRNAEFLQVKVEGVRECGALLAVVLMPRREPHLIGRRTMPDMDLASVGCAIQNMWLAARAEGLGLGWVSFFEPLALGALLRLPPGARAVALLCIGRVPGFYPRPMLETAGWGKRLCPGEVLFDDVWPEGADGTPAAY